MKSIIELTTRIRETEDVLEFITRYQIPFSESGFRFLVDEVAGLKTELCQLEAHERKRNRRLITNN